MKNINDTVKEMKTLADSLSSFSFPKVSLKKEKDVLILKQRSIILDGYFIALCLSKSDYGNFFLESLQIQSEYSSFLPFNIVCKLGKVFLGEKDLAYTEFFKENKKIYFWSIKTKDGLIFNTEENSEIINYEGFKFFIMNKDGYDFI
jgi:hypothetical protein